MKKPARSKRTSVRLAQRARIVLFPADGMQNKDIAEKLGVGRVQVSRWRERYAKSRFAGIERDLPRGAPPMKIDVARLIEWPRSEKPEAATHWSTRTMAAGWASAIRVSRASGAPMAKPPSSELQDFARSEFVEKLEDIVGLYIPARTRPGLVL